MTTPNQQQIDTEQNDKTTTDPLGLLKPPVREYINRMSSRHNKENKRKRTGMGQKTTVHPTANATTMRDKRLNKNEHVAKIREIVSNKLKKPFEEIKYSAKRREKSAGRKGKLSIWPHTHYTYEWCIFRGSR